jgi:uncharacterized protein YjbJ (UPF0337 family)
MLTGSEGHDGEPVPAAPPPRNTQETSSEQGHHRRQVDAAEKGEAQQKWGELSDDVFDVKQGDSQYLAGKLQEQFGWDRDRAQREVDEFGKSLH